MATRGTRRFSELLLTKRGFLQLTNSAWIHTIIYNFFQSSSVLSASPDVSGDQKRVLVIQGAFDSAGQELVSLDPAFRFPWRSQSSQQPAPEPVPIIGDLAFRSVQLQQSLPFTVRITDVNGGVTTVPFDARLGDDSDRRETVLGFFEVMVPVAPNVEVASVRIADATGGVVFGRLERSQPPTITIVAPQDGTQLGEKTEVA